MSDNDENRKPKWLTCLWILLYAVCLTCTIVYLVKLFQNFMEDHTATEMSQEIAPFPPMMFCPRMWLNQTKMELLNLTYDRLNAMNGGEILQLLNHTNFFDLIQTYAISPDARHLETVFPTRLDSCLQLKVVYNNHGLCYFAKMVDYDCWMSSANRTHSAPSTLNLFHWAHPESMNGDLSGVWTDKFCVFSKIIIGFDSYAEAPVNYIELGPNLTYSIRVTATHSVKVNKKTNRCRDEKFNFSAPYFQNDCINRCLNEMYVDCLNCTKGNVKNSLLRPCGQPEIATVRSTCRPDLVEKYEHCESEICAPLCDQWQYSAEVFVIGPHPPYANMSEHKEWMAIQIKLHNQDYSLQITEHRTSSVAGLISDIGGQVGLWVGWSLMSFYYIVESFYMMISKKNLKKSRNSRN